MPPRTSRSGGSHAEQPRLSWSRSDIEQRFLFRGGRYTDLNNFLTFLLACILTGGFYAALIPLEGSYFKVMFTERGPTPYWIVFFSCWSIAIILLKWRKLAFQRRALRLAVVPADVDFVLSSATTDQVMDRIHAAVDDPRHFVLLNRIQVALSNLRNLGRVTDVDEILRAQADQDANSMETTYALLRGFIWAIPVLGFIGTVLGLSEAIGTFGLVLGGDADLAAISASLKGVTGGLATAFETTLEALVAALVIQIIMTFLKKSEEEFLDSCAEYCLRNVVNRLRIMPFEQEAV